MPDITLAAIVGLLNFGYTLYVQRTNNKRYGESSKESLRYEALMLSKDIKYILDGRSFIAIILEEPVNDFLKKVKEKQITKDNIIKPFKHQFNERKDILNYKKIVEALPNSDIELIEDIFYYHYILEDLENYLNNIYEKLSINNRKNITKHPDFEDYCEKIEALIALYSVFMKNLFSYKEDKFCKLFKKLDEYTCSDDGNLYKQYELSKSQYNGHKASDKAAAEEFNI